MSIEIEGRTYPAIQISLEGAEQEAIVRRLKTEGRELAWSRLENVRERKRTGSGLVLVSDDQGRAAVFTDVRKELVLICKPPATYCAVCLMPAAQGRSSDYGERQQFDCPRCGPFMITRSAKSVFGLRKGDDRNLVTVLSYAIRHLSWSEEWPLVDSGNLDNLLRTPLPSPAEQPALLAKWLAHQSGGVGKAVTIEDPQAAAGFIGVHDAEGVTFIARQMESQKLLTLERIEKSHVGLRVILTLSGWTPASQATDSPPRHTAPRATSPEGRAVILTALCVETAAVLQELGSWTDEVVEGIFSSRAPWRLGHRSC